MAKELPSDTRGIVSPSAMLDLVDFERRPVGEKLEGLVAWFWSVSWDLPVGQRHLQQVINHPAANVSIGTIDDDNGRLDPPQGRVYGVHTRLSNRELLLDGWTVAARVAVGGLGVLVGHRASSLTDAGRLIDVAIPGLRAGLVADVAAAKSTDDRISLLYDALVDVFESRDPARLSEAHSLSELAALAERDKTITKTEHLAQASAVSVRTLQRLFDEHVGVSPAVLIRRWRIIDAAEAASRSDGSGSDWPGWSRLAAELGYSDQAHLSRDFKATLGVSPSDYVARQRTD